MFLNYY